MKIDELKIFFRVAEAVQVIGVPRSGLYELLRSGEIQSVKFGGRTLIPAESLTAWAERLKAEQGEPVGGRRKRRRLAERVYEDADLYGTSWEWEDVPD